MQSNAIHVKLDLFRDGEARLLVPAGMEIFEDVGVSIWHGGLLVLQERLKVERFYSGKAYLSLPCTDEILWQHGEKVIMGVTAADCIEIVRSAKRFEQVHIGPEDIDTTD